MILAVDPGLTTGWATIDAPNHPEFQSGMIQGRYAFYDWLYGQFSSWTHASLQEQSIQPLTLVVEKFTITEATAKKSPQPDPLYIIGHLDAIAHRDALEMVFQLPSQAMSFATNDKLKAVGWYKPGKGHDNDAARHLMLYAVKHPEAIQNRNGKKVLKTVAAALGITVYPEMDKPETPTDLYLNEFYGYAWMPVL
jgi:hypothetical protein